MPNKKERAHRAQMFLPFDALKGFRDYVNMAETVREERKCVMEDQLEILNCIMQNVESGCVVKIVFYENGAYLSIKGRVENVDKSKNVLQIFNKQIKLSDILDIDLYECASDD